MTRSHSDERLPPEVADLVELVGEFIEYWGFRAVEGKIWCLLFLAERPLGTAHLMTHLGVSKALVSTALRELQDYGVVREVGRVGKRTLLYEANPDLPGVIFNVLRHRERRLLNRIDGAARLLARLPAPERTALSISADRVQVMQDLVATASGILDALLALRTIDPTCLQRFQLDDPREEPPRSSAGPSGARPEEA